MSICSDPDLARDALAASHCLGSDAVPHTVASAAVAATPGHGHSASLASRGCGSSWLSCFVQPPRQQREPQGSR